MGHGDCYHIRYSRVQAKQRYDVTCCRAHNRAFDGDYLRNDSPLSNSVLYFGPMGCLTGFYLILKGTWTSKLIKEMIVEAFKACSLSKTIPGASEVECGNYKLNDLKGAKELCDMFSVYLSTAGPDKLNYPD